MEAAGIAPASYIPQVVPLHSISVGRGCQWLHYVCTGATLRELVANWHRLTPDVRAAIMELIQVVSRKPVNFSSRDSAGTSGVSEGGVPPN